MRTLHFESPDFGNELADFCRSASPPPEITASVEAILAAIRTDGDRAVAHYAAKFDGAKVGPGDFRVPPAELAAASRRLPAADRRAMAEAFGAVAEFNRRGLPKDWSARNRHGARVGEKFDPIRRVGLYIPGGQVPLVSTVLMTATLAKIARCPQIAAFTPVGAEGRVSDGILAALHLVGVRELYQIGGVQAIGAMAYGTASIPAVDKIFGPGNAYVCEAKRQVFGTVGVDSLPGPSEVMVIADNSARLDFAAADLLAQAEHGSGRERICLVALTEKVAAGVAAEIEVQGSRLSRSSQVRKVLEEGCVIIRVRTLAQAAVVANRVAPEHLELMVRDGAIRRLTRSITTAGAIMIGNWTPTVLGDFAAGPSHVLPTAGAGRYFSGLRLEDFLRRTSVIRYDKNSLRKASPVIASFSALESLDGHGHSAAIRLE